MLGTIPAIICEDGTFVNALAVRFPEALRFPPMRRGEISPSLLSRAARFLTQES